MQDLNALSLPKVFDALVERGWLNELLGQALREDLGSAGDITSASIISEAQRAQADLVVREAGVVCGMRAAERLLPLVHEELRFDALHDDGARVEAGTVIAALRGPLRALLAVERTMLNLLGRLSGIATQTAKYVARAEGTKAVICDTRKTTPTMRVLEKYAVRCGGGTLHRLGLFDAALYKDNHLAHLSLQELGPALQQAIERVRAEHELRFVEVEIDSLAQLEVVLALPAKLIDIVLLDNMSSDQLSEAVRRRETQQPGLRLEASGGVTLETVHAIAATGVDRISVGALTHSVRCLDVALEVRAS